MVHSILNPNINYPEIKTLDPDDKSFDATLYEINVLGEDIIIALGQSKYTFIEDHIIYFPIYLVKDDKVSVQIGVYEIMSDQLPNIVDDDGDIKLEDIDNPLIYSFINLKLLSEDDGDDTTNKKNKNKTDDDKKKLSTEEGADDDDDDDDDAEEPSADDEEEEEPSVENDTILPEQNEQQLDKEHDEYNKEKGQPWIQDFFTSNEYNLIDNEGGGDCLFAVIRDALKSIDKDVSVMELRRKIADEITPELYDNYKETYIMLSTAVIEGEDEIKRLNKMNIEYRDRLKHSKERKEQQEIVEQAKLVAEKYKLLKSEMKTSKELLSEFKFMKKVHSIDDLKKIVKTCEFWADTWAISTLERVLNIKLVIFSSEEWKEGSKHNVLQCGQLNDAILEKAGIFEPQYFILLDHTGIHYKLITYKYNRIFSFKELPYAIKLDIAKNCLQGSSGPYIIIPQFQLFNKQLGIEEPIELDVENMNTDDNKFYTDSIVFQFHNKANKIPLPGKGTGETISLNKIKDFSKLKDIDNWRRKMDNNYTAPFELDGHKWKTVEHYYQANKFKNTNKEFYLFFSQDSGSKISEDVELAKAAGSKSGKHKGNLLRNKDIKIDPDFFGGNDDNILENGLYAKFNQNIDLKTALLETQNAKLQHYTKGLEPEIANSLMLVRSRIKNE